MIDTGPVAALLGDGRLHLQQGPIDLLIGAGGEEAEVREAFRQAAGRFRGLLPELVEELKLLRMPLGTEFPAVGGTVAKRMVAACWPFRQQFITPMAAVAGSVADEVLEAMILGRALSKAYVNNGGDIALHIGTGEHLDIAVAQVEPGSGLTGIAAIDAGLPIRGVATSGWKGRSFSLGIADSATIFAASAAAADAAATIVGNAVDVRHPLIVRRPANEVKMDSDLGNLPVTVAVGDLPAACIKEALDAGMATVEDLRSQGAIYGACLTLKGQVRLAAPLALMQLGGATRRSRNWVEKELVA